MIIVEYPVAAVLKLWHLLLANVLGIAPNVAWVGAVVLLVLTFRLMLLPLAYRQIKSGRILANLRPQMREIRERYEGKTDPESRRELRRARQEVQSANDYKLRDGCLPLLIQLPVLIGLYRLLLRIARPEEGLNSAHSGYGPLSATDFTTFLDARLFGVPLPTYASMAEGELRSLGTSGLEVLTVALPLIIMASVFTTTNFIYSTSRTFRTVDYSQGFARFISKFMIFMGPLILFFPWVFGLFGPAPIALLLYWVCNNLWTAVQSYAIQSHLDKHYPYTDEFWEYFATQKQLHKENRAAKKNRLSQPPNQNALNSPDGQPSE